MKDAILDSLFYTVVPIGFFIWGIHLESTSIMLWGMFMWMIVNVKTKH